MTARPKAPPRDDFDALIDALLAACRRHGSDPLLIGLTAAATAVATLGAPPELHSQFLAHLAQPGRERSVSELWDRMADDCRYLEGRIYAVTGWLGAAREPDLASLRGCLAALSGFDLHAIADSPAHGGDLLGPVYSALRGNGSRKALGAHFSPASISRVIVEMAQPTEGSRVLEPTCGTGGLVIAAARSMRQRGLDPRTVTWVLNDLDPIALALAGVNASAHGLGVRVLLCRGDGLLLGTGLDGDPLLDEPTARRRESA